MSPKILFLYSSARERMIREVQEGNGTDTALRGMNHIRGAAYLTIGEYRDGGMVARLLGFLPRTLQAWLLIPRLLRYDFVIAQDDLFLGYIVSLCARGLRFRTRWLYITMTSSTLLRRHAAHPIRLFLLRKFWSSYHRIICISSEQIEDLVRFGIARDKLVFVPFGVDTRFFRPTDSPPEGENIVSVGRDPGRDYATLFKAAERVSHEFVAVAGHRNIPSEMPRPANVSVRYNRNYTEIRELYERARLVVIASKDTQMPEGSDCSGQTVILDAMVAGKPVIATRRPWMTDYFVPGEDLVVVEPHDPDALAGAISALWDDAERRKRIAASGHAKTLARYTTEAFALALRKIIDNP